MKFKLACNIMIAILLIVILFHFLVLSQIINYKNVWGGKLSNENEMYVFETISICLNAFLLFVVLQKAAYIKQLFSAKIIETVLWIFIIIFGLNTVGNLFANNMIEKTVGTILTLVSAYLCFMIVRKNNERPTQIV